MSNKVASIVILYFLLHTSSQASFDGSFVANSSFAKTFCVCAGLYVFGEVLYQRICKLRRAYYKHDRGTLEVIEAIVSRIIMGLGLVNSNDLRVEVAKLQTRLEDYIREHQASVDKEHIKMMVLAVFKDHMEANFALYENVIKGIAHDVAESLIKSLDKRIEALEDKQQVPIVNSDTNTKVA